MGGGGAKDDKHTAAGKTAATLPSDVFQNQSEPSLSSFPYIGSLRPCKRGWALRQSETGVGTAACFLFPGLHCVLTDLIWAGAI